MAAPAEDDGEEEDLGPGIPSGDEAATSPTSDPPPFPGDASSDQEEPVGGLDLVLDESDDESQASCVCVARHLEGLIHVLNTRVGTG